MESGTIETLRRFFRPDDRSLKLRRQSQRISAALRRVSVESGEAVGTYNSATILFGNLPTQELSRREKEDRTEERHQYPSCICLGYDRNLSVALTLISVASSVVFARTIFIVIVVRVGQRGKSY